jgi:hypothetical protein
VCAAEQHHQAEPASAADSVNRLTEEQIIAIVDDLGDMITAYATPNPNTSSTSTTTSAYGSPTTQKHERCGQTSILPRTVGIRFVSGDRHEPIPH